MPNSVIANSSTAFRQKVRSQLPCSIPSVLSTSFHSFEVVGTPSVASMPPLLLLLSSVATAESSIDMRSSSEMASLPKNMRSRREMTSPARDIVTTAGCSETTAAMSTVLVSTPITDVEKELYYSISQQAECDEKVHTEHHIVT